MINNAFDYASTHDGKTPAMPFPECGAMSQGYIGYQLSQAILNDMKRRGIMRSTACVVTQTVVYPEDPAFQNPTKPVGAFLTEEEAMQARRGDRLHLQGGRRPRLAPGGGLPEAAAHRGVRRHQGPHGRRLHRHLHGWRRRSGHREGRQLPWRAGRHRQGPFQRQAGRRLQGRHAGHPHGRGEGVPSTSTRPTSRSSTSMTVAEARGVHRGGPVRARLDAAEGRGLHRVRAAAYPRARRSSPRSSALPTARRARRARSSRPSVLPAAADARASRRRMGVSACRAVMLPAGTFKRFLVRQTYSPRSSSKEGFS